MTPEPTPDQTLAGELRAVPMLDGFTDAQVAELAAAGWEE